MADYIATNGITTLKIKINKKGQVREVDVLNESTSKLIVWQYLDLLAQIMPKHLHFANYNVELGTGRGNHPCLILEQESTTIKYYQLDKTVDKNWPILMPVSQLRGLVFWWRGNRSQVDLPICEWSAFRNPDT